MIWINTKRILKLGFTNFWRNGIVSIASVLTMTVTLFVVGSLFLGSAFLTSSLDEVKNKVDISVSFKVDADADEIIALKKDLSLQPEVKSVDYIGRDQELADFKEAHKDNAILLQSLEETGNPFGARLNIKAIDPAQYDAIARFLANRNDPSLGGASIIDQISYKKDVVDKLVGLIATGKKVGLAISIVLILLSILVTFNTISLAIYISRDEIAVMRLVGAGESYVRYPFLVEGIISGIISAFLSLALLYPSTLWVRNVTAGIFGGVDLASYYINNFAQIFLLLTVCGIILGIIASFWATRKYAKV